MPSWFSRVFPDESDNQGLQGFFDAIVLVLETGFAVTAFATLILNLIIPEEEEEEDGGLGQDMSMLDVGGEEEEEERQEERGRRSSSAGAGAARMRRPWEVERDEMKLPAGDGWRPL